MERFQSDLFIFFWVTDYKWSILAKGAGGATALMLWNGSTKLGVYSGGNVAFTGSDTNSESV